LDKYDTGDVAQYINRGSVVELLSGLVRIPSPYFHEQEVMEFAHEWLGSKGIPVEYHHFHEDRIFDFKGTNIVGRLRGDREGPTICLNGHLDTVKLCEGWTKDPFGCEIEGDLMYGLGTCDMKSGCAAIMLALEAFINLVPHFSGEIVYSFVSDEEGPFGLGTDALILDGIIHDGMDVAVITEPSSSFSNTSFPSLSLGARGGWNYRIEVHGKSSHGGQPECGINAISEAARILLEIEKTELKSHEKLGPGSICCIDFQGGGAALSVPDLAAFSVFRHVTLGEDKSLIIREIEEAIERAGIRGKASYSFRNAPHPDCDGFPAYVVDESDPHVQIMKECVLAVTGNYPTIDYFSSVGDFCYTGGRLGIPTLVIGPRGGNFHSADEYVDLETVTGTSQVVFEYLKTLLTY